MTSLTEAQQGELKRLGILIERERACGRKKFPQSIRSAVLALHQQGVGLTMICDALKLSSSMVYKWKSRDVQGHKKPRVFAVRPPPDASPELSRGAQTPAPKPQALHLSLGQFALTIQVM